MTMPPARNKFFLKRFCALGLALVFAIQPVMVLAQLDWVWVPISHPGLGQSGIAGSAAATAANIPLDAAEKNNEKCQEKEAVFGPVDHGKEIGFGGLSLIGGSSAEVGNIESKLVKLEEFIKCREFVLIGLHFVPAVNLLVGQRKQRLEDDINTAISNLKQRKEDLFVQSKIAKRGLWKGILAAVLIRTTKAVAQRLVNTLTAKFKINDVMKYADVVASQVYTTQLIRDRATDGQEQLILRSIVTNPALRNQVDSAIYQRAADALELNGEVFSARGISADDPNFYLKLAKFGAPETSSVYLKKEYENRAAEMKSVGVASAQNEILLGSGLKAPRTCQGNVAEQKGIDLKWAQANDKMQNRLQLYQGLKNAYDTRYKTLNDKDKKKLAEDFQKAQNDYLKAGAELKNLPQSFKSPVLEICKAIASPAEMVNKGIDAAFKSFSKGLSDYNDNNLPFFMSFIADIGSNIASSLIFGGDLKATLLHESGDLSAAINLGLNFVDAKSSQKNLENGIRFDYFPSAQGNGFYNIEWEILDIKDANYVTIKGPGISDVQMDANNRPVIDPRTGQPVVNKLSLSGVKAVPAPSGGTYSLRVFNERGLPLSNTGGLVIPPPGENDNSAPEGTGNPPPAELTDALRQICAQGGLSDEECRQQYLGGGVHGAFTRRLQEPLRGNKYESLR